MADVALYSVYTSKQNEFGTRGAGLDRFKEDFLTATNRAINQMNRDADLSGWGQQISRVDSVEDTVTNLDVIYEDVLSSGITVYLAALGQRLARGAEDQLNAARKNFEAGITSMYYDLMNRAIASDADDEEDFIGLGALGGTNNSST